MFQSDEFQLPLWLGDSVDDPCRDGRSLRHVE